MINIPKEELEKLKEAQKLIDDSGLSADEILFFMKTYTSGILNDKVEKRELNPSLIEQTKEEKIQDFIAKIQVLNPNFNLLRPAVLAEIEGEKIFDFYRTLLSIGINQEDIKSSRDLEDHDLFNERSIQNFETNYKMWVGKKLFLSEKIINEKTIEDIDNIATHYLDRAINHVHAYYSNFSSETKRLLRSEYFDEIHNGEGKKTLFVLLKYLKKLKKRESLLKKEQKNSPRESINYDNIYRELNKAYWEIQRIFALTILYIDREKNQNYQHTSEDIDFLVNSLENITDNEILGDGYLDQEKPLYHIVDSKKFIWNKDENGAYKLEKYDDVKHSSQEDLKKLIQLEEFKFRGRLRPYQDEKTVIKALHICSRMKKGPYSSVDKFIRKNFNTFDQIMDNKGFMIVVENFDEGKKLSKLLENELGTGETSWVDETVFMNQGGNSHTNSSYNCLKGTIKIPYKGKLISNFFKFLEDHFRGNVEMIKRIGRLKKESDGDGKTFIKEIENILIGEFEKSKELKKIFNDLKAKFRTKEYNIEVEIQIFDQKNFFKAEIDESSPAYHGHYKKRQVLDGLGYICPIGIYGEKALERAAGELI